MFQALSDSPADSQACGRIFARTMHPPVAGAAPVRKSGGKIRIGIRTDAPGMTAGCSDEGLEMRLARL